MSETKPGQGKPMPTMPEDELPRGPLLERARMLMDKHPILGKRPIAEVVAEEAASVSAVMPGTVSIEATQIVAKVDPNAPKPRCKYCGATKDLATDAKGEPMCWEDGPCRERQADARARSAEHAAAQMRLNLERRIERLERGAAAALERAEAFLDQKQEVERKAQDFVIELAQALGVTPSRAAILETLEQVNAHLEEANALSSTILESDALEQSDEIAHYRSALEQERTCSVCGGNPLSQDPPVNGGCADCDGTGLQAERFRVLAEVLDAVPGETLYQAAKRRREDNALVEGALESQERTEREKWAADERLQNERAALTRWLGKRLPALLAELNGRPLEPVMLCEVLYQRASAAEAQRDRALAERREVLGARDQTLRSIAEAAGEDLTTVHTLAPTLRQLRQALESKLAHSLSEPDPSLLRLLEVLRGSDALTEVHAVASAARTHLLAIYADPKRAADRARMEAPAPPPTLAERVAEEQRLAAGEAWEVVALPFIR